MNTGTGVWTRVMTGDGSLTLAHPVHGQTCHSAAGAWTESRERYARACRVRERALELAERGVRTLHLLDVGTGLGLNLAAALEALDGTGVALAAVTFEIDPDVIRATLACGAAPNPELERHHATVRAVLETALGNADGASVQVVRDGDTIGHVRLLLGDARVRIRELDHGLCFDAVFLDPFSPGVEPALWESAFVREIARRMAPGSCLSTYTVSMGVRAALLRAGLQVGAGARVGTKAAGTLASPDRAMEPLDPRSARRLAARAARGDGADPEIPHGFGFPGDG